MTKRQEEIIDTALKLISEKGIQGLTIKNISKEIGISEPAIYRHFENKTDILIRLLDNFKFKVNEAVKEINESDKDDWEKIHDLLKNFYSMFNENPSLVSVIFSEEIFKYAKLLTEKILEILNFTEKNLLKLIARAQKDGIIRQDVNKKYLALLIVGSMRLLVKKWAMDNNKLNIVREGEKLFSEIEKLVKI